MIILPNRRANRGGAAGGPSAWNPADMYPGTVLSNNDFTATTGADRGGRCLTGKTSGKWYFEATPTDTGTLVAFSHRIGISRSDFPLGNALGNTTVSCCHMMNSTPLGYVRYNGAFVVSNAGLAAALNDIVMFALDMATGNIWIGINGTWYNSGDPATGTNPTYTNAIFTSGTWHKAVGTRTLNTNFHTLVTPLTYAVPGTFLVWA